MALNLHRLVTQGLATLGLAALWSPILVGSTLAQTTSATEDMSKVGACRATQRTIEIFSNSQIGTLIYRVGTLGQGEEVTLTGVLKPGLAQVQSYYSDGSIKVVGWVDAGALSPSCIPAGVGTDEVRCYRLDRDLNVRAQPSTRGEIVADFKPGDITENDIPPITTLADGYTWVRALTYLGNYGWTAIEAPDGSRYATEIFTAEACGY